MSEPLNVPPPGLDGTWRDSCAVCLCGTDTALQFKGEAEWAVAGLQHLGIPEDQALSMVSDFTGCDQGNVPVGEFTLAVRVCQKCAAAGGMEVGLASGSDVPTYAPRRDQGGDP